MCRVSEHEQGKHMQISIPLLDHVERKDKHWAESISKYGPPAPAWAGTGRRR